MELEEPKTAIYWLEKIARAIERINIQQDNLRTNSVCISSGKNTEFKIRGGYLNQLTNQWREGTAKKNERKQFPARFRQTKYKKRLSADYKLKQWENKIHYCIRQITNIIFTTIEHNPGLIQSKHAAACGFPKDLLWSGDNCWSFCEFAGMMLNQGILSKHKICKNAYWEIAANKEYLKPPEVSIFKDNRSLLEKKMYYLLVKLDLIFTTQHFIKNLYYDISDEDPSLEISHNALVDFVVYIDGKQLFIETNGEQHYKYTPHFHRTRRAFERQLLRDKTLDDYAFDNDIYMLWISFKEIRIAEKKLTDKIKEMRGEL